MKPSELIFPTLKTPPKAIAVLLVLWIAAYWFVRVRTGNNAIAVIWPMIATVRMVLLLIVAAVNARGRWNLP